MKVDNYSLASFNELTSAWEAAEGAYKILFGASSAEIRATAAYQLKKPLSWPVNDVFRMQRGDYFPAVKDAAPAGQGLRYSYREGEYMNVKGFLSAPEKTSGITNVITSALKEREDHFCLIFTGLLKVDRDGVYRLFLRSDDGSRLVLDGKPVLDLDYDGGGYQEVWLTLEAGFHRLEIDFWDNFAEEYIEVGLKGPGISAYNLPASLLFHE